MIDVWSAVQGKCQRVETQLFDTLFSIQTVSAAYPIFYTLTSGIAPTTSAGQLAGGNIKLKLWPQPNAANVITCRYWHGTDTTELSADTDIPIIPVRHHWAIVALATAKGLASDDQMIQSNIFQQQAEEMIQQMISEDVALMGMGDVGLQLAQRPEVMNEVKSPTPQQFDPMNRPFPEASSE